MRRSITSAAGIVLAGAAIAACGSGDSTAEAPASAGSALPQGSEPVELDPAEFTTEIDNPWWPMEVGSRWVYTEEEDGDAMKVVVKVTDETRTLANGVEARVVRDVVTERGVPVEVTDDFYAQDAEGNIWYMGEETTEYENGKPVSDAGSFEAGSGGAQPGIAMPADPADGMTYRQEYLAGEAEDQGEVLSTDEQVEVAAGRYEDAVMTRDTNPLEPNVNEHKFYARGVGPVLTLKISGGSGREELVSYAEGG